MSLRIFKCDSTTPGYEGCGAEFTEIEVDGYAVGDRLLEDVWFVCSFDETSKKWSVRIREDCAEYFEQFNAQMWLKAMREFVAELDLTGCHKCKEVDIVVNESEVV